MLKHPVREIKLDQPFSNLEEAFTHIVFLQRSENVNVSNFRAVFRQDGFSYLHFQFLNGEQGCIGFAPLYSGSYSVFRQQSGSSYFDFYDAEGKFLYTQTQWNATPLFVDLIQMEPHCVFMAHLYNILAFEYAQADKAEAQVSRINLIEQLIRSLSKIYYSDRRFENLSFDAGFQHYNQKLIETEMSHALRYTERQKLRKKLFSERKSLIDVKARVHKLSWFKRTHNTFAAKLKTHFKVMQQRPSDVIKGASYRYTIGLFLWFLSVVRNNIGYSIALAVYGPFTFYFITQPMNPHAMWAVGKVRSTYIETVSAAKKELSNFGLLNAEKLEMTRVAEASSEMGTTAPTATPNSKNLDVNKNEAFARQTPKTMNILLSSDIKSVSEQPWADRMSHFKDMQIGYEENLQFSERMGRLEQMESQLNFPLIAESAYRETERYLKTIDENLTNPKFATLNPYLEKEKFRTLQTQLYIWDRLVRFMFDHQYIMLDISNEQKPVDYYTGRSFIFLKELTDSLTQRFQGLPKPKNFSVVEDLAEKYADIKVKGTSLSTRLEKNSYLATQDNFYNTKEMRENIRRQWEVLFLLQSKAQEASNFGLQMYTWSVRNAIWVMQSIYSNKDRELRLINSIILANGKADLSEIRNSIEPLYESLFHILTMEYVSIKTELGERLANDIESLQRKVIIQNTQDFFSDREQVLKSLTLKN